MNFRIRNIHTWMIIQKCKELGIESRFVVPEKEDFLELKKGGKTIVINRAVSPFLKHIPGAVSEDKITCNHILQSNGFPLPPFIFSDSINNIESEFLEKNAPIVAKPYDTNKGAEIHMNIKTLFQLKRAIENIKKLSSKAILQKQAAGKDYRILIIDREVVGVLWNEWPFVVGDGIHTIQELVIKENERRETVKIDIYGKSTEILVEIPLEMLEEHLAEVGHCRGNILPEGEKLYVGNCGNGWAGAIAHDVTDIVHPEILKKAVELSCFLDIDVAGLDVRCEDVTQPYEQSQFNLIEVNIRPSLVDHEFPMYGRARNVTEKYLNYLFR